MPDPVNVRWLAQRFIAFSKVPCVIRCRHQACKDPSRSFSWGEGPEPQGYRVAVRNLMHHLTQEFVQTVRP